jgi:hypothetical protein
MGTAKPPVDVPVRIALAAFYAALRYDGILILDQRNYDEMLDHGFMPNHKYYDCGDHFTAEPQYLDESLARFKYSFPDGCEYTLNMFPLRKGYARQLIREAGFDRVRTYGDFQKNYQDYLRGVIGDPRIPCGRWPCGGYGLPRSHTSVPNEESPVKNGY